MIPKIIHQIWVGPKKRPDIWMDTFKKNYINNNQDWEYKLWDDKNISELFDEFPTMLKIYNIERTYNGKSDLLRYLILYTYGGIYIDADSVWINNKSFDNLLSEVNKSKFFLAYEPNANSLCGGIMGSSKKNKYIKNLIDAVENIVKRGKENKIYLIDYKRQHRLRGAANRIGPGLLTRLYLNNEEITKFPAIYFYPNGWHDITRKIDSHTKLDLPNESYTYQYGYTINGLGKFFE